MTATAPHTHQDWWTYVDGMAELHAATRAELPEATADELADVLTAGRRYRLRSGEVHTMWSPFAIATGCTSDGVVGAVPTTDPLTCTDCAAKRVADYEASAPVVEVEPEAVPPVLVVIACGKEKRAEASPAGELYVGQHHRRARAAADALVARIPAGARVMILSARHGLVDLVDVLAPYDVTLSGNAGGISRARTNPGEVDPRTVARQLAATGARTVVSLASARYTSLLAIAARTTGAELVEVMAGTRSIFDQVKRLTSIRTGADWSTAIVDAVAGPVAIPPADPIDVVELVEEPGGQFALAA